MGDLDRLAQVMTQRSAALALYARQWLDAASAEDVVQEALTALLTQRTPPDDPVAWTYRAVRNAAIDQTRAASRRRRREQVVAAGRREWFEPTPDAAIDARTAEEALRNLPSELREVVVLRIWGGLGFAAIAAVVNASLSTAHNRYVAAMGQLRAVLEKPCGNKTT